MNMPEFAALPLDDDGNHLICVCDDTVFQRMCRDLSKMCGDVKEKDVNATISEMMR